MAPKLTNSQKNYLIAVLSVIVLAILGSQFLRGPGKSSSEVDPSLVPINISKDSKKTEYTTPYQANQVRNTVVKNNPQIQSCYLKHLEKKDAITTGRIQIDWQITPSGDVLSPQVVVSNLDDKDLEKCILEKFQTFKFPPPPTDKPVYSTFNYAFHREGDSIAPQLVTTPKKKNHQK